MKSVSCPYCKMELTGNFQPGDIIECASCKGRFQPPPGILKESGVSKEICPFCKTAFSVSASLSSLIQCPSCNGKFSKGPIALYATVPRPKNIQSATILLVASLLMGSILYVILFALGRTNGNWLLMNSSVGRSLATLPWKLLTLLFAWKLFKGRNWARILFNLSIPIGILFALIQAIDRHAVNLTDSKYANFPSEIVFWFNFFVTAILGIVALWYLNSGNNRNWFHLPRERKSSSDYPWWILVLLLVVLCPVGLFLKAVYLTDEQTVTTYPLSLQEQQNTIEQTDKQLALAKDGSGSEQYSTVPKNSNRHYSNQRTERSNAAQDDGNTSIQSNIEMSRNLVESDYRTKSTIQSPDATTSIPRIQTEVVNGIVWTFSSNNRTATIGDGKNPSISKSVEGFVTIPDKLAGLPVVGINDCAFVGCCFEQVSIPGSVRQIGNHAFLSCEQLVSVVLNSGVSVIGNSAFSCCEKLDSIVLPDSVSTIGNRAFFGCKSLSTVVLPKHIRSIGINPFSGCANMNSIYLDPANTLFVVNDGILFDQANKRLITFPSDKWVSEYSVPNGVLEIGESAFDGCSSISRLHLPNTLTTIRSYAFEDCSRLSTIEIPAFVSEIGSNPFTGCLELTSILVSTNNHRFFADDGGLYGRDNRVLISYPEGKDGDSYTVAKRTCRIGDRAFHNCQKLRTIDLPSSLEEIEQFAFFGCSISRMTIPSSVKSIGPDAFMGCRQLRAVKFLGNRPNIALTAFVMAGHPLTLYISRHATGWDEEPPPLLKSDSIQYFD